MIIFFNPIFFDKIWGGSNLKEQFIFNTSSTCGECWGISAHKNGDSIVKNGILKGKSLSYLFKHHSDLFGFYDGNEFPILVKMIDASKNLSIQVHPGDNAAKKYNSLGKSECWYILDTNDNTKIIIGHSAKTKTELIKLVKANKFDELLNTIDIKKGDYFYINSGTIHAICAGTLLLEVQQSSDITFRLYDYNRLENGIERELHVDKATEVITVPDNLIKRKHDNTYFDYKIIENKNTSTFTSHIHGDYIVCLRGKGKINEFDIIKGDFLMISSKTKYILTGDLKIQRTRF